MKFTPFRKKPLVSIIIPVYNGERFLRKTLDSVHNQTYRMIECIIVDDGSIDNTLSFSTPFLYDNRFHYAYQENAGAASALNKGIRDSKGEYIAWLSADDVFMPKKIERQVEVMISNPDIDMTYTDFCIVDEEDVLLEVAQVQPPEDGNMFRQVLLQNIINGSSVLIKRTVFDEIGYFREDIPVDVDGDMWLRMIGNDYQIQHIPEILLKYRKHAGQLSHNRARMLAIKDQVRAEAIRTFVRDDLDYTYLGSQLSIRRLRDASKAAYGCLHSLPKKR